MIPPRTSHTSSPVQPSAAPLLLTGIALLTSCTTTPDPDALLRNAIQVHGVEALAEARVTFGFREYEFAQTLQDGWYRLERATMEDGVPVREVMTNEGTVREVDGAPVSLSEEERASVETGVNSVVYFAFLPLRLQDPAVVSRYLGEETLEGEAYHRVEVTFRPDGGGRDWEDRFLYWLHQDEGTLDYMAYRYHVGDGGTRFRRAVSRRTVDGVLVQDYENLVDPELVDIAEYGRSLETGALEWVSDIVLEDVSIEPPPEGFPHDPGAPAEDQGP